MFPLDFARTDEWTLPAHHIRDELLKLRDSGTERLLRRLDVAGHGLDSVMVVAATEGSASLTDNTTAMGTCKGLLQCENIHMCPSSSLSPAKLTRHVLA